MLDRVAQVRATRAIPLDAPQVPNPARIADYLSAGNLKLWVALNPETRHCLIFVFCSYLLMCFYLVGSISVNARIGMGVISNYFIFFTA